MVKRYSRTIEVGHSYSRLWRWLIILSVLTLGFLFYYIEFNDTHEKIDETIHKETYHYKEKEARAALEQLFIEKKLSWENNYQQTSQEEIWKVRVPAHYHLLNLHLNIKEVLQPLKINIIQGKDQAIQGHLELSIGQYDSIFFYLELKSIKEAVSVRGQVAIIVDDFGDRIDGYIQEFGSFGQQITISILPGRRFSQRTAKDFKEYGCELMLHLPMEPLKGSYPDKQFLILSGMKPFYVRDIIKQSLENVPGVSGVNNHMGSRATSDRGTMEIVMGELAQQNLYFVDSRTTKESVAFDIAKAMKIPTVKKDFFLDNELNKNAIKARFEEMIRHARSHGKSVGICHSHRITLKVLQEEIPKYRKMGIQFLPVSKIID